MKVFGTISELVKLAFRTGGKEVRLEVASQNGSGPVVVTIPDVGSNAANLVTTNDVGTVTSTMIAVETIVNADISNSAAIADTKLATISTAGKVSNSATTATDTDIPFTIVARDASGNFSAGTITATLNGNATNITASSNSSLTTLSSLSLPSSQLTGTVAKANGGTGADNSSVTFPSTGTIVTRDATETLLNKTTVSSTSLATGALTLPAGTTAEQPSPTNGMIRYNTDNGAFEGYASGAWSAIGGGGTTDKVNQASHGFSVGDVLYMNGPTYTKADADTAPSSEVVGVVSRVVGVDDFEITLSGEVSGLTSANFTEASLPAAGEALFLSATPGKMTVTEPSVIGQVSVPIGVASGSGTMYVAIKRGVVVGGSNARTELPLSNNASTTIYTTPTGLEAGEIKGWVYLDATTDYRFFLSAQFARNGANSDWNLSYQTTGDTPPAGFNVTISSAANGVISIVLPNLAGFVSGKINYSLNAPAVGVTFPLAIDASLVTTGTVASARLPQVSSSGQGAFPSLTSSLDDATATQLGLKQYFHGTTYSGGNAPTVTSAQAGFSVVRAVFIPYQTQDGAWRLRFNIASSITSTSSSISMTISTNGVVYKNVTNFFQPVAVSTNGATPAPVTQSITNPNSAGIVILINAGTTIGGVHCSGDVELNGKPTWAY